VIADMTLEKARHLSSRKIPTPYGPVLWIIDCFSVHSSCLVFTSVLFTLVYFSCFHFFSILTG
jgi:hypothetical protein